MSGDADALRELINAFADHDSMTPTQEAFAEQARETLHYAAKRLDALDADNVRLTAYLEATQRSVEARNQGTEADARTAHDLLPTCPTCGGSRWVAPDRSLGGTVIDIPCPDCSDGHVPLARLVALWEAVIEVWQEDQTHESVYYAVERVLRSVKP